MAQSKDHKDAGVVDSEQDSPKEQDPASSEEGQTDDSSTEGDSPEKELTEYRNAALRARAELENYRKRMSRDRIEMARYAEQHLIVDLLPLLDNFVRALDATATTEESKAILEGLDLVRKSWVKVFLDHNVTEIAPTGKPFDPSLHEAVCQVERNDLPPNTVVEELRRGYMLHDRVIRAAQVQVSRKSAENKSEPVEESTESE